MVSPLVPTQALNYCLPPATGIVVWLLSEGVTCSSVGDSCLLLQTYYNLYVQSCMWTGSSCLWSVLRCMEQGLHFRGLYACFQLVFELTSSFSF